MAHVYGARDVRAACATGGASAEHLDDEIRANGRDQYRASELIPTVRLGNQDSGHGVENDSESVVPHLSTKAVEFGIEIPLKFPHIQLC